MPCAVREHAIHKVTDARDGAPLWHWKHLEHCAQHLARQRSGASLSIPMHTLRELVAAAAAEEQPPTSWASKLFRAVVFQSRTYSTSLPSCDIGARPSTRANMSRPSAEPYGSAADPATTTAVAGPPEPSPSSASAASAACSTRHAHGTRGQLGGMERHDTQPLPVPSPCPPHSDRAQSAAALPTAAAPEFHAA